MPESLRPSSSELEERRALTMPQFVIGGLNSLFEMSEAGGLPSALSLAEHCRVYRQLPQSGQLLALATFLGTT